MKNQEFGKQLELGTKKFAIRIIKLSAFLRCSYENNIIKNQITKSGPSIGANYREANRARSKADFLNKIKICESETNETIYRIEVIIDMQIAGSIEMNSILEEANELLAIFTSIGIMLKCP